MMKYSFRKSFFRVAGVLVCGAVLLAGCGRGAKPEERRPDPTADGSAPRIVFIAGDPQSNWSAAEQGAREAAQEFGAEIEWHELRANNALAEQKKLVYDAIESNASGIAVAPVNATELVPPVNKAGKNFVPALVFDSPAYTKFKLTFVTMTQREAGVLAAQRAAQILDGAGKAGVLAATPDSGGAESVESFEETLRREFPKIEIVSPATSQTSGLGVLFAPDETASRAFLKTSSSAQTPFIATGAGDVLAAALQDEKVDALIVPDRHKMAYESVRAILDYRAHRPPEKQIETAPLLVTKENLQEPQNRRALGLERGS